MFNKIPNNLQRVPEIWRLISQLPDLLRRELLTALLHLPHNLVAVRVDALVEVNAQRERHVADAVEHAQLERVCPEMHVSSKHAEGWETLTAEDVARRVLAAVDVRRDGWRMRELRRVPDGGETDAPPAKLPMPMCIAMPTPRLYCPDRLFPSLYREQALV